MQKKFIFFSLPTHGHTNPTLAIVHELVQKGYRVIYYSTDEFKEKVEETGAIYKSYPKSFTYKAQLALNIAVIARKILFLTLQEYPFLLQEVKKENPDCILYDFSALWGKAIATNLYLPGISFSTTIAFSHTLAKEYPLVYLSMIKGIFTSFGDTISTFFLLFRLTHKKIVNVKDVSHFLSGKDSMQIVFTSRYFQPKAESFDASFHFVGPSLTKRHDDTTLLKKLHPRKKCIYISLGTIYNDDFSFYKNCLKLFAPTPYHVVLSIGKTVQKKHLGVIPNNILVSSHVPQLEVLQKADVFISHAGMNSLSESLYYGVPLITLPKMYEQKVNALRVQELGAGVYLQNEDQLLEAVQHIFQTKSYKKNALKIAASFQKAGGYKKAVEKILTYGDLRK